jgi:dipeptidyl aminopeptidase/acylaminoacyl peptidase
MRIVHGDLDDVVPVEEAETLYRELKEVGADVELEVIRGLGHHIASVEIDTKTLQFFDRYLKPK